jgi:serine phosphatase RsbU (regulator of sigma subunit)
LVDISLMTPRRLFPRLRKFSIRGQLLLQVVVISIIAFSASVFAIWGLHRTGALLQDVRNSLGPAKSALQLANELEHIYGLSEAYQLSFNQPEQRQAILAEIEESKGQLTEYYKEAGYDGAGFAATIGSFLGSVDDLRAASDRFTKIFEERNRLLTEEAKVAAEAIGRSRQNAKNQTTLLRYKGLTEIAEQLQSMNDAMMRVLNQQQLQVPNDYGDTVRARLAQVAADEQQKASVLTEAREHMMGGFRKQLEASFVEFASARDSLRTALADGTVLSDQEAAELRTVLAEFDALFGDPQKPPDPATFSGNALLRAELLTGFRLNVMAQRELVTQLSKTADEIVNTTQQRIKTAGDDANKVSNRAIWASAIGLLVSIGLAIGFVVFVIDRNILRRLNNVTQRMRALARGEAIVVTGTDKPDELGEMARALQVFWKAELERRELQHKLELANNELQREVDESIYVAQRIQNGLLRGELPAGPGLSDQALLSRPCKMLGGDCYWLERFDDGYVVALIDCTGHGVPGAMMMIVTSIYMNAILHKEARHDPAEILLRLADQVQHSLAEKSENSAFDAGFDAAICVVDLRSQRLRYAGGAIPLIILDSSSGETRILRGEGFGIDRTTIGSGPRPVTRDVELRPGLRFYLTTDGLVTQPDGPCGIGFGWTRLTKILRETRGLPLAEQNERVWATFREFSANTEQRDDVTLVGFAA